MFWLGKISVFLAGCTTSGVTEPVVDAAPPEDGIPVGELIRGVHTCRKLPNQDACVMSVPPGTEVLAPFDGKLVNLRSTPIGAPPLERIFEGSLYSSNGQASLILHLGPLEMDIPVGEERVYRAGEVIGHTTGPELLVTLGYTNGKLRPLIHEAMPGQWPDHVPIPYKPDVAAPPE